jgi:uncharacterized protein (TIGR02217 family)
MSDNFLNIRFPVDISYGSSGGPEYNTELLTTISGFEHRYYQWSKPRLRFNVANGIKNRSQVDELLSFFRLCKGRYHAFKYKDWTDFKLKRETLQLINDTTYQIIKSYKCNNIILEQRKITKPIVDTIKVYQNNLQLNTVDFEIDDNQGLILLKKKTKENIKISCEFDIVARFDMDYLPITLESYNSFSIPDITILEIKN